LKNNGDPERAAAVTQLKLRLSTEEERLLAASMYLSGALSSEVAALLDRRVDVIRHWLSNLGARRE
jgi:hypothetical protein